MKSLSATLAILVFSVLTILVLPQAVSSFQNAITFEKVPTNAVATASPSGQVAGAEIFRPLPKSLGIPAPELTANAALVEDLDSNFILYTKNPDQRVAIASTTKIMTALVGLEHYSQNDVLTVTPDATVSGSTMGLVAGERLTFRSLLYGMLLNSGNDAAFTIAANYPGRINGFVAAMNKKAQDLGLFNTHFDNPAGFDGPNHFSSANNLAKIAALAAQNPYLRRVFATKETEVTNVDNTIVHQLKNLNILLGQPGVVGMKTGYTPEAKENFVGLIDRNNHLILTIVLGSSDRFGETVKLFDWTYQNFVWNTPS